MYCSYTICALTNQHPELCFVGLRAQRAITTSKSSLESSIEHLKIQHEFEGWLRDVHDEIELSYHTEVDYRLKSNISFYSFVYKLSIRGNEAQCSLKLVV